MAGENGNGPRTPKKLREQRKLALVLEMWESGQKVASIKRALAAAGYGDYSTTRITRMIRKQYDEVAANRRELGELVFDQHLSQLDLIVRANVSVLTTPCRRCKGRGHLGQDPDAEEGVNLICDRCEGEGLNSNARDRGVASKEFRQAIAEKNRMLGLYAPEKFAWTTPDGEGIDFSADLRHMSEDDLDAEFARVTEAMEASDRERQFLNGLEAES